MPARKKEAEAPKVKVENAVADGKGGYLPKGVVVEGDAECIASLKAKGLVE